MVLFDMDLYEPTFFAWTFLSQSLSAGDLVYFDEGFDQDERRVSNENMRRDFEVRVIGITHLAIAFQLEKRI